MIAQRELYAGAVAHPKNAPSPVTGGTGRFKGATGVLVVHRLLQTQDDTSAGTISGTIRLADGTTLAVGT